MKQKILTKLKQIEEKNNITIIYASESGSRAWGFNNIESDYDIRFIFKYNDLKNYISLSKTSEVIEIMDGKLDIVGWDVKKALNLHYNNNPNIEKLINYYKDNCKTEPDLELINQINKWIEYNLNIIQDNHPKKDKKKNIKLYDERFFNILF